MKYTITIILTSILAVSLFTANAGAKSDTTNVVFSESIITAIEDIDIICLNVLLAEGADVNVIDEEGNTPLMLASRIGNPRIVKIILAHNPVLNVKNMNGYTALMIASEQGQTHIVEQLLAKGASVSVRNSSGLTAADLAIRNGHPSTAAVLNNTTEQIFTR